jgi:fructose-bisphosphate aldolase class II/tagatose 1,6-diphosphate aldolase GatY/KbaY
MGLIDARFLMKAAQDYRYGIPAYDTSSFEVMKYVVNAAQSENSPVFLMLYPSFEEMMTLKRFADMAKLLAADASVPVVIHLDHSKDFEQIKRAIDGGFTSVMYDGSTLPYEENLENTASIAEYVHSCGLPIEAELGKVGTGSNRDDFMNRANYTDPDQAKQFVEATGIDYLAVAIGNSHGVYVETPHLDIELLGKLKQAAGIPLVLHGTSLIPREQVAEAVRNGICKVNIATELYLNIKEAYKKVMEAGLEKVNMLTLSYKQIEPEVSAYLRSTIRLLKSGKTN